MDLRHLGKAKKECKGSTVAGPEGSGFPVGNNLDTCREQAYLCSQGGCTSSKWVHPRTPGMKPEGCHIHIHDSGKLESGEIGAISMDGEGGQDLRDI